MLTIIQILLFVSAIVSAVMAGIVSPIFVFVALVLIFVLFGTFALEL